MVEAGMVLQGCPKLRWGSLAFITPYLLVIGWGLLWEARQLSGSLKLMVILWGAENRSGSLQQTSQQLKNNFFSPEKRIWIGQHSISHSPTLELLASTCFRGGQEQLLQGSDGPLFLSKTNKRKFSGWSPASGAAACLKAATDTQHLLPLFSILDLPHPWQLCWSRWLIWWGGKTLIWGVQGPLTMLFWVCCSCLTHISFDNLDAKYIHSFLSPLCNSIPTSSSWSGLITSARMAISLFACWVPWQKLFRALRQPIKFSFREGSSYPCSCSLMVSETLSVFPGDRVAELGSIKFSSGSLRMTVGRAAPASIFGFQTHILCLLGSLHSTVVIDLACTLCPGR